MRIIFTRLHFVSRSMRRRSPVLRVGPQCETIVAIRLRVCKFYQHVFRAKRKAEHDLPRIAMKRMRVLQADSVKSAMKAKAKLQKASKRAPETS